MHLLPIFIAILAPNTLGNPTIPSSPYSQKSDSYPDDVRTNNYNPGRGNSNQRPHTSYVIYDGDVSNVPGRPQMSSTRSWHLEFNQRNQAEPSRQSPPMAYSSIYSNLIQVYDKPQNKYFGGYENNNYASNMNSYNYHIRSRPIEVPKYDVVYPYESERQNYYFREKLPNNFPIPFLPNKDFQFNEPPITRDLPKNYGFYHVQTISYPNQEHNTPNRRDTSCNYIKLNERGFPVGNAMCGRSISDIILEPEYSTTGELVLEHRKNYRGTNQDRGFETNRVGSSNRKKRNTDNMSERFREFNSYNPNGGCCGGNTRAGYGYRPQFRQEFGNNDNRFMSRPYGQDNRGYGYRGEGQYYNNEEDVGEETSDNRGLTSYMLNRGRGKHQYKGNEDNYGDEDDGYSGIYGSRGGSRNGNSDNRRNVSNSGNGSHGRKSNNRGNESSNQSSNKNRGNSEPSRSEGNNRSVNNWRNFGSSDFEDDYGSIGGYNNRNGGENNGYLRHNDNNRNYGSHMYYGEGFGGSNRGFNTDTNMGGINHRSASPYGHNGYNANNRFSK